MIKTALKKPSLKNRVKVSTLQNHPGIMLQKTSSQVELKLDCM